MKKRRTENLDSFDKESFKVEFEKLIPQLVTEMSDLLEKRTPRLTRRTRQEMSNDIAWGLDVSIPQLTVLEAISKNPKRVDEGYRVLEKLFRTYFRRAKLRLRPSEDAFDYFIRKSASLLKAPYPLKRQKRFTIVRGGVEQLVRAAVSAPAGMADSLKLIEEFARKHLKEYLRFANTLDARITSYQKLDFRRLTPRNITRLTDLYRDSAAGFENRLRLLVGLNYIACGKHKTYDELRKLGYNQLLQVVESPRNSLLHFLQDAIDRHVRNAMMHGGVSSSVSKGVITFVDFSPPKGKETKITWTMNEFVRRTKNLVLTIFAVGYLEHEFNHLHLYCSLAAFKYLRSHTIQT
jgi:hypothetical protein